MGLHTELDVYKTGYDLLTMVTKLVENMERKFKQLIGEKIADETSKLLILVYRANVAVNKVPHLDSLMERVKLVEMLLRLSLDMEKISPKQYYRAIKLTESVAKQTAKWRAWAAQRPSHGGQGRHV
ncbi:four helix bundle protein [Paraburkholderia sp. Ac-20342]|uniref:four helix bundle protein n=1 Tax=Paraburkholderia sp. Ac-20342 TaxID=2703889 RepID=UPI00197F2649|nr:four helix bundle protein [Paraburkholderia sp. Ac-20342]MBN3848676.1 four helix bundle protein [Paraburkholderia sp. Ac-20342]